MFMIALVATIVSGSLTLGALVTANNLFPECAGLTIFLTGIIIGLALGESGAEG